MAKIARHLLADSGLRLGGEDAGSSAADYHAIAVTGTVLNLGHIGTIARRPRVLQEIMPFRQESRPPTVLQPG
ncbi:hypothetical protein EGT50_06935 [Rhodococcus xishaensis]|uniref:Uncharacterized protein n=1 Tax=Rhodococcus xishaensis TaxID=2487364 RepID=A0A3S3A829_9NOCA|nr:hypothetical protein EGT50_06935 [Rhodococcus xishaensis]